jgi:hypothetical protein
MTLTAATRNHGRRPLPLARLFVFLSFLLGEHFAAGTGRARLEYPQDPWELISSHFSPPPEWAGQFGDYRSPLRFEDGSPVRSAEDWARRRAEILETWHSLLGPWPPLITEPEVEVLETVRRENFDQLRIRFLWTPDEYTTGYLLIPDGDAPRPAVVTVFYEPETAIGNSDRPHRDFALQLARRGFVALSLGTTEATQAKPTRSTTPTWTTPRCSRFPCSATPPPMPGTCWPSGPRWMPSGSGSSGTRSAANGQCSPRACSTAMPVPPGPIRGLCSMKRVRASIIGSPGTWATIRDHGGSGRSSRPTTPLVACTRKLVAAGRDLHELHALMAPRPLLVSGGSEDPPRKMDGVEPHASR